MSQPITMIIIQAQTVASLASENSLKWLLSPFDMIPVLFGSFLDI